MDALVNEKFVDPNTTLSGEPRAQVRLKQLDTLWFNTGTLCNLACSNCYIESSPSNDRLVYITADEVERYLEEIRRDQLPTREIGFTGGEPCMNPEMPDILGRCLARGFSVLLLTNAMRPMMKQAAELDTLRARYGRLLHVRVSIDHYSAHWHEDERGKRSWQPTIDGMRWLAERGFYVSVAGRTRWHEDEADLRHGYQQLFDELGLQLDAQNPNDLLLFPEMDENAEVPEITTSCWDKTGVNPDSLMCASSRMVVKRKGADRPAVQACTLLPYDSRFELGETLAEASGSVPLNHVHCSRFCVLGGGSCSG